MKAALRKLRGSLVLRLAGVTAVTVLIFSLLTAWVLEAAFRDNAADAVETRLEAQVLLLMGLAEVIGPADVRVPEMLPESRLQLPVSGLYARILGEEGQTLWRSPSTVGVSLRGWSEDEYFSFSLPVQWELEGDQVGLTFQMLEDREAFNEQVEQYRVSLWQGLGAMTLSMILVLSLALWFWGLRPLRQVRRDLDALRHGDHARLGGYYPTEVRALTGSINDLVEFERARLARQQNALADLAHSLKTPISALRLNLESARPDPDDMQHQVDRLQGIVQHQLNQAQRLGPAPFQAAEPLAPIIERTGQALGRLAAQEGVTLETDLAPGCALRMDGGAIFELLGNTLDNAIRHATSRVRVTTRCQPGEVMLIIDDDGPGIPPADRARVLERGQRADTRGGQDADRDTGQGLGLSIIHTLVTDHRGTLFIEQAPDLHGARIRMVFPGG
ncbi:MULTISPECIES: HAMP domain-containing sensor histidine kinase [unclassified Thioalkalivibrio]|uniref:ATP-binding protein n=1 Tax=unclassified Thioalkalivibrio TaxID=2621013 RepID=UPI00037C2CDB|nr:MULTISPECIES: HAMP domain-containing sensor histidine kinase [unclassified Thioalkalivibrio]